VDVGPEKLNSAALKKVKSKTEYDENGSHPTLFTDVELESKLDAINVLAKLKGWLKTEGGNTVNEIKILVVYEGSNGQITAAASETARLHQLPSEEKDNPGGQT
jgi:hypothetical protein